VIQIVLCFLSQDILISKFHVICVPRCKVRLYLGESEGNI
jgi:hypothetical protein